jgi:hypothetical protein
MATLNDLDTVGMIHQNVMAYFSDELGRNLDAFRLRPVVQPVVPDPLVFNPEIGVTTSSDHGEW